MLKFSFLYEDGYSISNSITTWKENHVINKIRDCAAIVVDIIITFYTDGDLCVDLDFCYRIETDFQAIDGLSVELNKMQEVIINNLISEGALECITPSFIDKSLADCIQFINNKDIVQLSKNIMITYTDENGDSQVLAGYEPVKDENGQLLDKYRLKYSQARPINRMSKSLKETGNGNGYNRD